MRRRTAMRFGWGVADQALSSLTNFALGVAVARSVSAEDFGAYAIAFSTYLVALNVTRHLSVQPIAIRYATADAATWRSATAASMGLVVVLSVAMGLVLLTAGLVVGGVLGGSLVVLGITLPGLLMQDGWRLAFFAAGRGGAAFVNDATWTLVLFPGFLILGAVGLHASLFAILLLWGISGTVAAVVGIVQARVVPDVTRARAWWREHRDIGPRYLASELLPLVATQGVIYVLGLVAGLAAAGSLRAAQLVLGGVLGGSLVVLGVTLPGLLMQDGWRLAFFAAGRGADAFVNDATWTLVLFPGFLVLGAVGLNASLFAILLLWGISGTVAAVVGIAQARVAPDVTRARAWWREHRDIGPRYLASELLPLVATQGVIYVLGLVAGLAAAGSLRAAQLVLGPLNILTMTVYFVAVPVGARMYAERSSRLRGAAAGVSFLMVSATLVLTIAILAFPDGLGPFLLGESWPGAEVVFLPVAVAAIGKNVGFGPRTALLAMAMARRTLRLTSIESVLAVAVGSVGAVLAAASGAAWGLALVSCAVAAVWWREFGAGLRMPAPARDATAAMPPPGAPDSTIA